MEDRPLFSPYAHKTRLEGIRYRNFEKNLKFFWGIAFIIQEAQENVNGEGKHLHITSGNSPMLHHVDFPTKIEYNKTERTARERE